jgi:hypothetical protein
MKANKLAATALVALGALYTGNLLAQGYIRKHGADSVRFQGDRTAKLFVKTILSQDQTGLMKVVVFNSATGEEFSLFVRKEDVIEISRDIWIVNEDLGLKDL